MSTQLRKAGTADVSVIIRIVDSTDGTPETGVVYNTSGIGLWYRREGAVSVDITEATLSALTDAHSDGGFLHINDGWYRLDLPDAACAAGVTGVQIGGTVTGMVVLAPYVQLVTFDPFDTVRLGLTALPNAAADAAGGLPISDAGGLDLDTKLANTNEVTAARMGALTDWIDGGRLDLIIDAILTDTGTTLDGKIDTIDGIVDTLVARDAPLTAAETRTALGLSSANVDTQLAALATAAKLLAFVRLLARGDSAVKTTHATELAEIAGDYDPETDGLEAVSAAAFDPGAEEVDVGALNGQALYGSGSSGDLWRSAP